jgi:hypothetical protein
MKLILRFSKRERFVAGFGTAQLIERRGGHYELRGGSEAERLEAREWISLFLHEAVPALITEKRTRTRAGILNLALRSSRKALVVSRVW